MAAFGGVVLTLIAIGCAVMAHFFFDLNNKFHDPGPGDIALLFSLGAILTFGIALVLFVKAYMSWRRNK